MALVRVAYNDGRRAAAYPDNEHSNFWHEFQPPIQMDRPVAMQVRVISVQMQHDWPNVYDDSWIAVEGGSAVPQEAALEFGAGDEEEENDGTDEQENATRGESGDEAANESVLTNANRGAGVTPQTTGRRGLPDYWLESSNKLQARSLRKVPPVPAVVVNDLASSTTLPEQQAEPFLSPVGRRTRLQQGKIQRVPNYFPSQKLYRERRAVASSQKSESRIYIGQGFYRLPDLLTLIAQSSNYLRGLQLQVQPLVQSGTGQNYVLGDAITTQRLVFRLPANTRVRIGRALGKLLGFYNYESDTDTEYVIVNGTADAQEYVAPLMYVENPWQEILITSSLVAPNGGMHVGLQSQVIAFAGTQSRNAPVILGCNPWLDVHTTQRIDRAHFGITNRFGENVPYDAMCHLRPLIVLEFRYGSSV